MLLYDRKGNKYRLREAHKPKFLSINTEKIIHEKKINHRRCLFYQRKEYKNLYVLFNGEWFKGKSDLLKDVDELFDAETLIKL